MGKPERGERGLSGAKKFTNPQKRIEKIIFIFINSGDVHKNPELWRKVLF
jgi:hypothetical protein